jgi:hypothetical protein
MRRRRGKRREGMKKDNRRTREGENTVRNQDVGVRFALGSRGACVFIGQYVFGGLRARLKLSLARTRMAPFYEDVQGTDGDTSSGEPQHNTAAIIIKAGAWDLLGPKRVDQHRVAFWYPG